MAYDFKHVRILVVECSPIMAELLKSVLNMLTIPTANIYESYDMDEAFQKFVKINHDMVIADWLDKPDHGIKLTKLIRTHELSPNIYVPVIMTAGSGHENRVMAARDAGVSDYIVKPFSAKTMAERITRIIEDQRDFVIADSFVGPERRHEQDPDYKGPERRTPDSSAAA